MTANDGWPVGAVSFLFSDVEDSTGLWERHRSAMKSALAEHDRILHRAMDETTLKAAWREGRLLDLDAAVAYARREES